MGLGLHAVNGKQGAIKKAFLWRSDTSTFSQIFFLGTWLWWLWKVDLKGVSGGRKISQRLWLRPTGDMIGTNLQPQSWQEILDQIPRMSELESFLGLFIDPILVTNIWSDIYGGGKGVGGGAALTRGLVFVTFLSPAQCL